MDDDNERRDKPQDDRDEPRTDGVKGGAADVPRPSLPTTTRHWAIPTSTPTRRPKREPGRGHKGRGPAARHWLPIRNHPASPDRHPAPGWSARSCAANRAPAPRRPPCPGCRRPRRRLPDARCGRSARAPGANVRTPAFPGGSSVYPRAAGARAGHMHEAVLAVERRTGYSLGVTRRIRSADHRDHRGRREHPLRKSLGSGGRQQAGSVVGTVIGPRRPPRTGRRWVGTRCRTWRWRRPSGRRSARPWPVPGTARW